MKRRKKPVEPFGDPESIIAWNCNGLTSRVNSPSDRESLISFIRDKKPDVLFLSEVRMPADAPKGAKKNDGVKRNRKKYKRSDKTSAADANAVDRFLKEKVLEDYKCWFHLADTKYSGSCMLVRREKLWPNRVWNELVVSEGKEMAKNTGKGIDLVEGRVIIAEFESMVVMHSYTPNNGWTDDSRNKRKVFDEMVERFVEKYVEDKEKPLVWVGDLNCAPKDSDLSHPEYFKKMQLKNSAAGFSDAERSRFRQILEKGQLVDSFVELHPDCLKSGKDPAKPYFSWRGCPGKEVASAARYYGKALRIDHVIVAKRLMSKVESVEILGHGSERFGFMGSDHAPVALKFKAEVN